MVIEGASHAALDGTFTITVLTSTTFTYTFSGSASTDSSSDITETPWGLDAAISRPDGLQDHAGSAAAYDVGTGLYHFGARDYNPVLGRWMEQDPAGYVNGANVYQVEGGAPVGRTDTLGTTWSFDANPGDLPPRAPHSDYSSVRTILNRTSETWFKGGTGYVFNPVAAGALSVQVAGAAEAKTYERDYGWITWSNVRDEHAVYAVKVKITVDPASGAVSNSGGVNPKAQNSQSGTTFATVALKVDEEKVSKTVQLVHVSIDPEIGWAQTVTIANATSATLGASAGGEVTSGPVKGSVGFSANSACGTTVTTTGAGRPTLRRRETRNIRCKVQMNPYRSRHRLFLPCIAEEGGDASSRARRRLPKTYSRRRATT